jgi:preprotein translocase SecE subunit
VAWPTRAETINYSTVVLITLIIVISLIFALDWLFAAGSSFLFK